MMKSPDPKAPLYWGMFSKVEPKLQAGVLIGLGVACADFSTPNMMAISSPITNLMATRGVRFVNFSELRKPGTAIFMIVPEGDAERYKRILSTFIGIANDCLRNGELNERSAPVLFNLDEIGNIHIPDLPAALGVGRGRKMTYALGIPFRFILSSRSAALSSLNPQSANVRVRRALAASLNRRSKCASERLKRRTGDRVVSCAVGDVRIFQYRTNRACRTWPPNAFTSSARSAQENCR
jgi:hypothetical protein